jgi:hypothetical protein
MFVSKILGGFKKEEDKEIILAEARILQEKALMMYTRARNPRSVMIMDVCKNDGAAGADD